MTDAVSAVAALTSGIVGLGKAAERTATQVAAMATSIQQDSATANDAIDTVKGNLNTTAGLTMATNSHEGTIGNLIAEIKATTGR